MLPTTAAGWRELSDRMEQRAIAAHHLPLVRNYVLRSLTAYRRFIALRDAESVWMTMYVPEVRR